MTKFVPHANEQDVIWANKNTQIDDPQDTEVDISFRKIENETDALSTTKDGAESKVNQPVIIPDLHYLEKRYQNKYQVSQISRNYRSL